MGWSGKVEEVSQRSKYDRLEEAAAEQVTQIKLHFSDKRGIVPWPWPRPAPCHVLEAISNSFVISRTIFRIHLCGWHKGELVKIALFLQIIWHLIERALSSQIFLAIIHSSQRNENICLPQPQPQPRLSIDEWNVCDILLKLTINAGQSLSVGNCIWHCDSQVISYRSNQYRNMFNCCIHHHKEEEWDHLWNWKPRLTIVRGGTSTSSSSKNVTIVRLWPLVGGSSRVQVLGTHQPGYLCVLCWAGTRRPPLPDRRSVCLCLLPQPPGVEEEPRLNYVAINIPPPLYS